MVNGRVPRERAKIPRRQLPRIYYAQYEPPLDMTRRIDTLSFIAYVKSPESSQHGESIKPAFTSLTDTISQPSNLPNLRRLFVEARTEAEESAYSRNAVSPNQPQLTLSTSCSLAR